MQYGVYMAFEVVGARDRENKQGVGILPRKRGYQVHAPDISPACVKLAVGVYEMCRVR